MFLDALHLDSRAQTTQDFAIALGLFLLVIVFVLMFIPSLLAPFAAVAEGEQEAQAERVATTIVSDTKVETHRVHLNSTEVEALLSDTDQFDLPQHVQVNITITGLGNGEVRYSGGVDYRGQGGASWTRIVTTTEECPEGCRLTVRVWS